MTTREITNCRPDDVLSEVLAMMLTLGLIHLLVVDPVNMPLGEFNDRGGLRAMLAAGPHEEKKAAQRCDGHRLPMTLRRGLA